MKKLIKIIVCLFSLSLICCQDEPVGEVKPIDADKVISKGSELFNLVNQVVTPGNNPTDEIVCIDFIYPFKVYIYDANLMPIGTQLLNGDAQFSNFLGALPNNQSISISYPISTILADGTVFSINNNAELKLAIDSCSKEDIISYCSGLFGGNPKCVWKIQYTPNEDNRYVSGVFDSNGDGTLSFYYNNQTYLGTWTFLFLNNELHMNINLEGNSQVAIDWNIDRKIEFFGDKIKIFNNPKNIFLIKFCEETTIYNIGDTGPGGGKVFYDKGSYSKGWRYIESAPNDLGVFEWGCLGSTIPNSNNVGIGFGILNTAEITNYHDNLLNFYTNPAVCNNLNNGTVASKNALILVNNNFNDWFLPSKDELNLMYNILHLQSLGNFSNAIYWSSTEFNLNNANTVDFSNGNNTNISKITTNIKTRAIRYF